MIRKQLEWCGNLDQLWENEKYKLVLGNKNSLNEIRKVTIKFLKYSRPFFVGTGMFSSIGALFLGLILPESIYPKFSLPIPFVLPFKDQENWIVFGATAAIQVVITIVFVFFICFLLEINISIILHFLGMLDIVREIIEKLGNEILDTRIKGKRGLMPFVEWMKIITDLVSDINSVVTFISNSLTTFFVVLEAGVVGVLLLGGLIFMVVKEHQPFAMFCWAATFFLFLWCLINEKLLDKYEKISKAFYDIPWYYLEVNEQKMLLIALNCNNIQPGFTAAGMHKLTLDRFTTVMKIAYRCLLILKDMVQEI
ncbi:uncharacterized protein LOC134837369 [Culicoides brevitarsis]|uniref:uncharacterized protein LOC134837369 n=1 Tax=Culicoides brevitarsis TaxID=469753 RepID=UPI00307B2414